jgi:hypothetical protein
MNNISSNFPVTNEEYLELNDRFGKLAEYAAWQLIKANSRNNHTDSQEDVAQELRISLLRAGSYYKRQIYIETCLELCWKYARDKFILRIVEELIELWKNKTRHGANRQKFGPHQEKLLYLLTKRLVPKKHWPSPQAPLKFDARFTTYCKNITWNQQKSLGKKITRERCIRSGLTSLSNYDYLAKTY